MHKLHLWVDRILQMSIIENMASCLYYNVQILLGFLHFSSQLNLTLCLPSTDIPGMIRNLIIQLHEY